MKFIKNFKCLYRKKKIQSMLKNALAANKDRAVQIHPALATPPTCGYVTMAMRPFLPASIQPLCAENL